MSDYLLLEQKYYCVVRGYIELVADEVKKLVAGCDTEGYDGDEG